MLFVKKHNLQIDKPLSFVRKDFISLTDNVKVVELSEAKLQGVMKNKRGRGYDILSNISLKPASKNKTNVEIKNEFDLFTNLFLMAMFIGLWGISIYKLINGVSLLNFELILMLIFPIIGGLIVKYSFGVYEKRIMKVFTSLFNNEEV